MCFLAKLIPFGLDDITNSVAIGKPYLQNAEAGGRRGRCLGASLWGDFSNSFTGMFSGFENLSIEFL